MRKRADVYISIQREREKKRRRGKRGKRKRLKPILLAFRLKILNNNNP
jgi:hypothetical protein